MGLYNKYLIELTLSMINVNEVRAVKLQKRHLHSAINMKYLTFYLKYLRYGLDHEMNSRLDYPSLTDK